MKDFEYKNHLHEIEHVGSRLVLGDEKRLPSPLVTVIMPIYNHPEYFKKSLSAVLNQRCDFEYEVIIVDNGHPELQKDNQKVVEELMTPFTWYYVNNENVGGCNNQNMGILLANGKYITFCHDDDVFYKDTLQNLINEKRKHPNEDCAIYGRITIIDENDNVLTRNNEWDSFFLKKKISYKVEMDDFLLRNYSNGCGSLYDRIKLLEIGGFCTDYIPTPDYALNAYYTALNGAYAIRNKTLMYRVSPSSDTGKVYPLMIDVNKRIRYNILKSGKINHYPKWMVDISLKTFKQDLYSKWGKKSKGIFSYIDKTISRLWLYFIYWRRSQR